MLLVVAISLLSISLSAQKKVDTKSTSNSTKEQDEQLVKEAVDGWWTASMVNHDKRIQWWRDAKFGMFLHWGVYSNPGGEWKGKPVPGYSEHLMRIEKISRAEYLELSHQFNPTKFNADAWAKAAKEAGMNYMIITSKHHDGFAMYPSKVSNFNVMQQTAWKHDPMKDLSAACKKYGIKFGFYYSHAYDWEHPDAPGNTWDSNYAHPSETEEQTMARRVRYVNEKSIPQIKELLAMYHPDILWFDTPQKLPFSENIRILQAIRAVDNKVVINGRLARLGKQNLGDYKNTSDRPAEFYPTTGDWEAIPTTNESYGYSKFDSSHKSVQFFVRLLAKAASRNGNLLLNVGPKGDGEMDTRDLKILSGLSGWLAKNNEAIYKTTASPLAYQSFGVTTAKAKRLYLHVFNSPTDGQLIVGGIKSKIGKAWYLADPHKKALAISKINDEDYSINISLQLVDTLNTVIVVETKEPLVADSVRLIVHNMTTRLLGFDAELIGKGFGYGDGKKTGYYVEGWKTNSQSIHWKIRTNETLGNYKLLIKYISTADCGGSYKLSIGNQHWDGKILTEAKSSGIITNELGIVELEAGIQDIELHPTLISNKDLMRFLELQLVPVE